MIVDEVVIELGEKLAEIPTLKVLDFEVTKTQPLPATTITLPLTGTYGLTYGDGLDTFTCNVTVWVSRTMDKAARTNLAPFISGQGDRSVRAKLGARNIKWRTCDVVYVRGFDTVRITMGELKYLAAVFPVEVHGRGA